MIATIPVAPLIRRERIRHVRQSLSPDEQRAAFRPRLYVEDDFGSAAIQSPRQR